VGATYKRTDGIVLMDPVNRKYPSPGEKHQHEAGMA